jgi:hypothetical protein
MADNAEKASGGVASGIENIGKSPWLIAGAIGLGAVFFLKK